jgi:hypothetical protein
MVWAKWIALPIAAGAVFMGFNALSSFLTSNPDILIFRSDNLRSINWIQDIEAFHLHPVLGIGIGALETESGGSDMKMLAEGGIIGSIVGVLVLVALMSAASRSTWAIALIIAGMMDAIFEGWLFTDGSMYCVIVFLVAATVAGTNQSLVRHNDSVDFNGGNAAVHRRFKRFGETQTRFTPSKVHQRG